MTDTISSAGAAARPWSFTRWGLRADIVFIWSLFCSCYWLYPWWSRGNVSWDLKFVVLSGYTAAFIVLLSLWGRMGRDAPDGASRKKGWAVFTTPWGLVFVGVLLVAAGLQFRETFLPILSGPDEPYRVAAALDQWSAIAAADAGMIRTILALLSPILLWAAGLVLMSNLRPVLTRFLVGVVLLFAGLVLNYEMMLAVGTRWGGSPRWPPLGTLFEVVSFSVFGLNEAASRLPSVVFFILTGVVLFRLLARETAPLTALVAGVSVLSSPAFFTQGQLASRETAGVFFMTAAAFFLVRRCHSGRDSDLGWSIALTLAAFLTRRPAIIFASVIVIVEAARLWLDRAHGDLRRERAGLVHLVWTVGVLIAGAFPWMFATRTIRPFELSLTNWFDPGLIIAYPARFPVAMGLVVTSLGLVGVIGAVAHRRVTAVVALVWLAVVYGLFTSDVPEWIPTWRFLALMCPPVAILAAEGYRVLGDRLGGWSRAPLAALVGIGVAASVVAWSSCASWTAWLGGAPCRERMPRYPFEEAVSWMNKKTTGAVVATPATYWQTSLDVYAFFLGSDRVTEHVPLYGSPTPPLQAHEVSEMCRSVPVDFVIVPSKREAGGWSPVFMGPAQAEILAQTLDQGPEDTAVFSRGRFRLEIVPCPED